VGGRKRMLKSSGGTSPPSSNLILYVSFRNADNGEPISFKQDGQRFGTSQKTLKLFANAKYKCSIKCRPAVVEFQ